MTGCGCKLIFLHVYLVWIKVVWCIFFSQHEQKCIIPPISGRLLFWKSAVLSLLCWTAVKMYIILNIVCEPLEYRECICYQLQFQDITCINILGGLLVIWIFFPYSALQYDQLFFFSPPSLAFPHLFCPPSQSHMTQIDEKYKKMERAEMYWTHTHTHTSVVWLVSIFSSALSATFTSPGHSVPRDTGKSLVGPN